jgi:hypothetical protein
MLKAFKDPMFYISAILLLISLSLLPFVCEAGQSITVKLEPPSMYTDGSPLSEGDIIGYRVFYAVDGLADEGSPTFDIGPLKTFNINLNLDPREAPYTINVTAQTIGGSSVSDLSNRVLISRTVRFYVRVKPPVLKDIEMFCDSNCLILEDDGI